MLKINVCLLTLVDLFLTIFAFLLTLFGLFSDDFGFLMTLVGLYADVIWSICWRWLAFYWRFLACLLTVFSLFSGVVWHFCCYCHRIYILQAQLCRWLWLACSYSPKSLNINMQRDVWHWSYHDNSACILIYAESTITLMHRQFNVFNICTSNIE